MYEKLAARDIKITPEDVLKNNFASIIKDEWVCDALFLDTTFKGVLGICNLPFKAPAVLQLLKSTKVASYLIKLAGDDSSVMILKDSDGVKLYKSNEGVIQKVDAPEDIKCTVATLLSGVEKWAGELNENGEHIVDLCTPVPGPHFYVNLLLGNRVGHDHALQTTPKSVVDRLGRGSFRSHAATQVLATRWDTRQDENGFPANRQFYLVEDFKNTFYSGDPKSANIKSATCTHSQNHTIIKYTTNCGLEIKRTIFILPQIPGMPLAVEVQRIEITNLTNKKREINLVYTGMFGPATPHAIFEDVTYTNVIMQSSILKREDGSITAISPDYYPQPCKEDIRFSTLMIRDGKSIDFPKEFCANYNEFVGSGTLENPENLAKLSNHFYSKGPGFFALAGKFELKPLGNIIADNFTGISSGKVDPNFTDNSYKTEIQNLINLFSREGEVEKAFKEVQGFLDKYSGFMSLETDDPSFNTYVNKNLPFQVLYQTFVSRSFCQTQKGYREIGFREIQDIFASMYYFVGMGESEFVKKMLKEWCSMIFEFGFAYHNFFWEGKEPGKWSDDALWFVQAVYRYINLTGDLCFLDEQVEIAGTSPSRTRSVYETIKALLRYSGEISIGKHGMPLLDSADWNDCLKLDKDFIDGITKEKLYRRQLEESGDQFGEPLKSDYTESVMNAFLLKVAIDETLNLSIEKGDAEYSDKLKILSKGLYENIQKHAWKEDFFARALFNRFKNNEFEFLGAGGDKLSADPQLDGSYFLNSFSWSILADAAKEEQISRMLDTIEKTLKTPYGLKVVTLTDLGKLSDDTATGHYFPGDRENGGVFKHAAMMATVAMFKAAKQVGDRRLARRLANLAYWMVDLVAPHRTMDDPFLICGNPRFCTQYNNSETGENIGPMLSGTSTWMILTLMSAYGVEYTTKGILIDPIIRENHKNTLYSLSTGKAIYKVKIKKPGGFYRMADDDVKINVDGNLIKGNLIPLFSDNKEHRVEIVFG